MMIILLVIGLVLVAWMVWAGDEIKKLPKDEDE